MTMREKVDLLVPVEQRYWQHQSVRQTQVSWPLSLELLLQSHTPLLPPLGSGERTGERDAISANDDLKKDTLN